MRDRERGAALIWALVLLFFAAALSAVLLERGRAVDTASKTDLASLKAHYAAEGGLALARQKLRKDPSYTGERARVGECDVETRVERRDGGWHVVARAEPGGVVVSADLVPSAGLPAIASRDAR